VIEILLQAERTLAVGRLDEAERLYRQASEADPRNSIAVVGLARVALERDDEPGAYRLAKRALAIDPENVAAQRLSQRLEEVYAYRGQSIAALAGETKAPAVPEAETQPGAASVPPPTIATTPSPEPDPPPSRGLVDRLLRRSRP
jgi:tetratricopeptide (TPR) repeat protein